MKTNMKIARIVAGVKQVDIARGLGVSKQTVNKWEMGRAPVARKHWSELASLLQMSESELEKALVQTLLDACLTMSDAKPLLNAQSSRQYDADAIANALASFYAGSELKQAYTSNEQTTELREQILKLREENLKLRETIIELRERCATPYRVSASTPSQYTSTIEESEVSK